MNLIYFIIYVVLFVSNPIIQIFFTSNKLLIPEIWSFYSNSDSANIALPDSYATYFSSFVYLNNDEYLSLNGLTTNYSYYSLQIYDSRAITLGNVNYLQSINNTIDLIITKNISNLNNLNNKTNNIIIIDSNNTIFLIVFRVYDLSEIPIDAYLLSPNISITHNKIGKLKKSHKFVNLNYNWLWPDTNPVRFPKFSNVNNNFLKPALTSFFYNGDASYLLSNIQNPNRNIGLIVSGILPNSSQVLYSSFNIGVSSPPMPTISGKHYGNDNKLISSSGRAGIRHVEIEKRYQNITNWNRNYTIYIGLDLNHITELGGNPDFDLYLLYPIQYFNKKPYSNILILHRHLMPHSNFLHTISNISNSHADPNVCEEYMNKYYPKITFVYK